MSPILIRELLILLYCPFDPCPCNSLKRPFSPVCEIHLCSRKMNADNNPSRPQTLMADQAMDPQLLQNMLVALTYLQIQLPLTRDPRVPDLPVFNGNNA